jgi:outer membrane protein assembly factor BamB
MDARLLLLILAIVLLVGAASLGVLGQRLVPQRRAIRIVAGGLAVLSIAGFVLSVLALPASRAPLPASVVVYYVRGDGFLEAASAATGTVRWRYQPPSQTALACACVPTFANGVFYLGSGSTIRAVRASDGKELWTASVVGLVDDQVLAVDHGVVYATTAAGVFALRAQDGSQLWQLPLSVAQFSTPSAAQAANGIVYVAYTPAGPRAASETIVDALGESDGALRWTRQVKPAGNTSAAADGISLTVADGMVYAQIVPSQSESPTTVVYALGAGDGRVHWTYGTYSGNHVNSLIVADGTVYLRSISLGLVALDAASGSLLWQRSDLGGEAPMIVANGVIYLSALLINSNPDGAVLALDAHTGSERWHTLLSESDYVTLAGQMLYVSGDSLYALRTSDGHVVWRYGAQSLFFPPVVSAGVVFVGSSDASYGFHPFGIGSNNFLNALDARTGALYWRTSGDVEAMPLVADSGGSPASTQ